MSSATSSTAGTSAKDSAPGKSGKQPGMAMQLITAMLGTWIGLAAAGGVLYFLVSSGKISMGASSSHASAEGKGAVREITLEPILANLADEGGHGYVRLGLRVELTGDAAAPGGASDEAKKADTAKGAADAAKGADGGAGSSGELESSIRDTVLAVLGRQTSSSLLGPDGKEHLKIELKEAIERGGVRVDVKDLFFTDFLVQS